MNDVGIRQIVTRGDHGLARLNGRQRATLIREAGTGGAVNRPRDAPTRHQLGIRRVNDSLDIVLASDIAHHAINGYIADLLCHGNASRGCCSRTS
jgi:hypothetical protein